MITYLTGRMLQSLKLTVYQAAKKTGYFAAVANSSWRRNRLVILCYHGIALDDEHRWNPGLYVTAALLRRRLEMLRQSGCNILPLGEAVERLHKGDLPVRSVVLTFDDGFFDFYREAAPVLREYQVPATVYVSSYYAFLERPVFDPMLGYLLWKGAGKTLDWPEVMGDPVLLTSGNRTKVWHRIAKFASEAGCSALEKDVLLGDLASRLAVDYGDLGCRRILQLMNPNELRNVAALGFDLQLHTHRHRMPPEKNLFVKEIEDNRRALAMDGQDKGVFRHFCYPSGIYYAGVGGWLRECGILSATTCEPGLASQSSDPYYLPRFSDSMNVQDIVFEGWVSGVRSHSRNPGVFIPGGRK
jgi:peptidoglycan/xylan/chitin deacetylase (PgdA/CDA1 family)